MTALAYEGRVSWNRGTRGVWRYASAATLALMVVVAVAAPLISRFGPLTQDPAQTLAPPGAVHWLGTDQFGRDILSRLIYGTRISLLVGVLGGVLGALVGVPAGLLAGYLRRWVDTVVMRMADMTMALPGILLAIAILAMLGPGTMQTALVIAVAQVAVFARLTRSLVLRERELDYVSAARLGGSNSVRIMFRHILPNTAAPIVLQLSMAVASAVLLDASLSFLGLGTQPPTPSWGGMLADSQAYMTTSPWYAVAPGLAITILVLSLIHSADAIQPLLEKTRQ